MISLLGVTFCVWAVALVFSHRLFPPRDRRRK